MLRSIILAALLASASTVSMAQPVNPQRSGTPEEQKACAKDVSRYCQSVMNDSDFAILACLKQNRERISKPCDAVLVSHGQ